MASHLWTHSRDMPSISLEWLLDADVTRYCQLLRPYVFTRMECKPAGCNQFKK